MKAMVKFYYLPPDSLRCVNSWTTEIGDTIEWELTYVPMIGDFVAILHRKSYRNLKVVARMIDCTGCIDDPGPAKFRIILTEKNAYEQAIWRRAEEEETAPKEEMRAEDETEKEEGT